MLCSRVGAELVGIGEKFPSQRGKKTLQEEKNPILVPWRNTLPRGRKTPTGGEKFPSWSHGKVPLQEGKSSLQEEKIPYRRVQGPSRKGKKSYRKGKIPILIR